MFLATLDDRTPDGRLVVVARTLDRCAEPGGRFPTLQAAVERWCEAEPVLRALAAALDSGAVPEQPFDANQALAPLPRAWQWLDGSAFPSHGNLMSTVFGTARHSYDERPLMYQGMSDRFLSGSADVPFSRLEDGIDFEGEFAVITDAVPMGTRAAAAAGHIRLVALLNDWSLRRLAPIEMKTGFGWIQAKPASSVAPVVVTPDELGGAWRDARLHMRLEVRVNDRPFGAAHGGTMAFGFHDLIAHAAYSRDLVAGTLIGSGTVSNVNYREVGSSCIAERRAIETLDEGAARTPYLSFGDRVTMQARYDDGRSGPFGRLDQTVVRARTEL